MAGPGWGRVRCGVRQREAAHRVAAEAREWAQRRQDTVTWNGSAEDKKRDDKDDMGAQDN